MSFPRTSVHLTKASRHLLSPINLSALALACAVLGQPALAQGLPTPPIAIPLVRLIAPEAGQAIQIQSVQVTTELVGLVARSRIEIQLRNPNGRELEGELQFPLSAGQTVTGFALDINGELRPAVTVEKAKGRQVFEDVTRQRVDPALLENTGGNNYKLRVYPLPAQGTRTVVLEISENLRRSEARAGKGAQAQIDYRMPLNFGPLVSKLEVRARVSGVAARDVKASCGALPVKLEAAVPAQTVASFSRTDFRSACTLQLSYPASAGSPISVGEYRGEQYFYAEIPAALETGVRPAPRNLALLWDASGSAARRDQARELDLLDAYLKQLDGVDVALQVVRDSAEPVRSFRIEKGNWQALRQVLSTLVYDGASNLSAFKIPQGSDLALWFSDGLGTYGAAQPAELLGSSVPVISINSAASANPALLQRQAQMSAGAYLDLGGLNTEQALREMQVLRTRILSLRGKGLKEVLSVSPYPVDGRFVVAGKMTQTEAELELEWVTPSGASRVMQVPVRVQPASLTGVSTPMAATAWARMKLTELEVDRERNLSAYRSLASRFNLVTPETSLIVLDSVADYVRYEILPPASLMADYERLTATKRQALDADRSKHLERIVTLQAEKAKWWNKDFPKNDKPAPPPPVAKSSPAPAMVGSAPPRPAPMAVPAPAPPAPAAMARSEAAADQRAVAKAAPVVTPSLAIKLQPWSSDSPLAKRMKEAKDADLYAIYLDERASFANSTGFFLDAAEILMQRGQSEMGLRALSNLAEMDLENRHILRILAYRLVQAKQPALAIPLLEKVLRLSPDEPQSWRDLGLALADAGRDQEAIVKLWEVVSRPWNNRFPGVELIALAEINAIVARHAVPGKTALDTSVVDPRLLKNMSLDLRVVLSWDADNTDMDLWVTDPNGERVFYGHRLSYQGGFLSNDFTGGYGPEEFSLRFAKPGKYTVQVEFYGHRQQVVSSATTLMLKFTTGFGTPAQQDQTVIRRLSGQKTVVTVGTFEVGASAAKPAQ